MLAGEQVSVQHPVSWEGFQLGLQECPDRELVQFILHAIKNGAALGTAKSLPHKDPFRCRNGRMCEPEIDNLSHPFGGDSVNSLVSPEEAWVSYQKFNEFVH